MDKEKLGHYEIQSELGRGGMGVVYKAHDPTLNRDVAIKVLSEALAHDESVVERFMREAKSMAALNDAHIIQIYFIGDDQGQPYFVMEFVEGESLSQRLKREGKLSVADSCALIRQTANGLALAHSKGVIHRDIKPGNLMITPRGKVKIADFGIAMVQDYSKRLTNTGEFVGTPGYLSPEVCVGQPVDHRSDIFALGIVFFEMLTGKIPFTEVSPLGMMLEVVKAEIPDVRSVNQDVDERTCNILKRMIAKDPEQRYQSCDELVADLGGSGPVSAPGSAVADQSSEYSRRATTALSQLEQMPELAGGDATMVSVESKNLAAPPAPPRSRALPIAIAAVMMLAIGAGSIFLFRDRIFGLDSDAERPRVAVAANAAGQAIGDDSARGAGDQSDGGPDGGSSNDGKSIDLVSNSELDAEIASLSSDDKASGADNKLAAQSEISESAQQAVAEPAPETPASHELITQNVTTVATDSGSPSRSIEQAASEPTQLAKVSQPPAREPVEPPGPPPDPRFVVVTVGDRAIAGPVEQMLEDALQADSHILLDEAFFPGIGSVAGERGVDLAGLSSLIRENGGDVLVLAEVDYLGETPLQYYGQSSTLYSVNVKVRNILLSERRPVGKGWQHKVDFTNLNADQKAREAVEPYLAEFKSSLRNL